MSSRFDAIDYAQQLEAAGVPKSQAEVHAKTLAHVLNDCAPSAADLQGLDDRIGARIDMLEERVQTRTEMFEERVQTRIDLFEERITARMDAFEAKVDLKLEGMRGQIARMQVLLGINTAVLIAMLVRTSFP